MICFGLVDTIIEYLLFYIATAERATDTGFFGIDNSDNAVHASKIPVKVFEFVAMADVIGYKHL